MSSEDTKILKFNQGQKSDKVPFIIYADLKCTIEKIDTCKNNPENSSTTKIGQYLQYCHLKVSKISMMYIEVKVAWKCFLNS